jgi:hypothetical protein
MANSKLDFKSWAETFTNNSLQYCFGCNPTLAAFAKVVVAAAAAVVKKISLLPSFVRAPALSDSFTNCW